MYDIIIRYFNRTLPKLPAPAEVSHTPILLPALGIPTEAAEPRVVLVMQCCPRSIAVAARTVTTPAIAILVGEPGLTPD